MNFISLRMACIPSSACTQTSRAKATAAKLFSYSQTHTHTQLFNVNNRHRMLLMHYDMTFSYIGFVKNKGKFHCKSFEMICFWIVCFQLKHKYVSNLNGKCQRVVNILHDDYFWLLFIFKKLKIIFKVSFPFVWHPFKHPPIHYQRFIHSWSEGKIAIEFFPFFFNFCSISIELCVELNYF